MKITDDYVFFFTYNDVFSNWRRTPFYQSGWLFYNVEQYMMHQKAILFSDKKTAMEIIQVRGGNPKDCKALGRKVAGYDEEIWKANRERIVKNGIWLKARSNNDFYQELMYHHLSGRKFVEASPYDRIWGIGFSEDKALGNEAKWGLNLLGKCLDETAAYLKEARNVSDLIVPRNS